MPLPITTTSAVSGSDASRFILTMGSERVLCCHADSFHSAGKTSGPQGDVNGIVVACTAGRELLYMDAVCSIIYIHT